MEDVLIVAYSRKGTEPTRRYRVPRNKVAHCTKTLTLAGYYVSVEFA